MKRTTVFLEESLRRRALQVARSEGKSFAQVVREALTQYVAGRRPASGKLPGIAGQFASGTADTSERADELLWDKPHS